MNWSDYFIYDENSPSGLLSKRTGKVVGSIDTDSRRGKYKRWRVYTVDHGLLLAHRVVWELNNKKIPDGMIVEHKDKNALNNKISNLRIRFQESNTRNSSIRSDNTSGTTGVGFRYVKDIPLWFATWREDGKTKSKSFSVNKYGDASFDLAVDYRNKMIKYLILQGKDYTPIHGKD